MSTLHERFLSAARAEPDRVAAVSPAGSLTYGELAERALAIAAELRGLGVRQEALVGISISRGLNQLAGVLGILCAGAAYVPLETNHPLPRLREIVKDAGLDALITDRHNAEKMSGLTQVRVLVEECKAADPTFRQPSSDVNSLAYVIYTSGTTGVPNGVEILHRSALEFTDSLISLLDAHSVERVVQFSPLSFDLSVHEIFPTLLTGRSLWVMEKGLGEVAPEDLLRSCCNAGVDMVTVPPSYLMAADPDLVREVPSVIGVAGERCPPVLVRRWSRAIFYNFYGPTEATVEATYWRCTDEDTDEVPIGVPYPHVNTAVMVDGRILSGPGRGELYVGGPLARGYLGRPELTAERFRTVDQPDGSPERMYATGDIVERRPDGALVFIARADRQVKLRGQRLELADVESALCGSADVDDAVVLVLETEGLADRLIAFVRTHRDLDPKILKDHVAASRPPHMVPARIYPVPSWPLTRNGKIDREALRRMAAPAQRRRPDSGEVAPLLAELWAEMLESGHVEPDDDFFDLGGHSILAVRLVGRLRRDLHVDLPVESLYEHPTLRSFTDAVTAQLTAARSASSRAT